MIGRGRSQGGRTLTRTVRILALLVASVLVFGYGSTASPSIASSVRFELDGQLMTVFSSEAIVLDKPVGRSAYRDLLPAIFVERPGYRAALGNPGPVSGLANVFEATFRVAVIDASGRTLTSRQATASCGTGCWGTFGVTVSYTVPAAQWGSLGAWDVSARDGSVQDLRAHPVWLTPAP